MQKHIARPDMKKCHVKRVRRAILPHPKINFHVDCALTGGNIARLQNEQIFRQSTIAKAVT
jgi:hypothetical protein